MRSNIEYREDTVAAVVTAPGAAGVSIVRVSGPEALAIADRIFNTNGPPPSERSGGTFLYGRVVEDGCEIDEALLLLMRAPKSYTAEDTVEIQGHGGSQCSRRILRAALAAGARPAEPGEFTRRAFLHGRIDLLQAEAVLDLIQAGSERAAAAALEQLEGGLSSRFEQLYQALMSAAADIEATLDFSEEDLPGNLLADLAQRLEPIDQAIGDLIASWEEGHLLRDGALVVISGAPNVGKSTLLNALLGAHRAIVSNQPGTTRDSIEEVLVLDGFPLRLVDTAGLRDTACDIEAEGVERSRNHMQKADLHLHVVDASAALDPASKTQIQQLDPGCSILVLNKSDLGNTLRSSDFPDHPSVETALLNQRGLDALKRSMQQRLEADLQLQARPQAVISERHRDLLVIARKQLKQARICLDQHGPEGPALASSHLRDALEHLGLATGKNYTEDLLDQIFSQFCIGK